MSTPAPAPAVYRSAGSRFVATVGVLLTLGATLIFPLGGIVVGVTLAYVVWGDDEAMKRKFCMLAGVATIAWAVFVLGASLGTTVTTSSETGTITQSGTVTPTP